MTPIAQSQPLILQLIIDSGPQFGLGDQKTDGGTHSSLPSGSHCLANASSEEIVDDDASSSPSN